MPFYFPSNTFFALYWWIVNCRVTKRICAKYLVLFRTRLSTFLIQLFFQFDICFYYLQKSWIYIHRLITVQTIHRQVIMTLVQHIWNAQFACIELNICMHSSHATGNVIFLSISLFIPQSILNLNVNFFNRIFFSFYVYTLLSSQLEFTQSRLNQTFQFQHRRQ